jgi:hypothetical protein
MAFEQHNLHKAARTELCLSLDHEWKVNKVVLVFLYTIFIIQQAMSVAGLYT